MGIEAGAEAVDEGDCAAAGRGARTWVVRAQALLDDEFFMSTDCDSRALIARATFSRQMLRLYAVVFLAEPPASPSRAGR